MRRMALINQDALDFLARVAQVLDQPDLERGISELIEQISEYLHTEAISVFVLDEPTGELVLKYAVSPVKQEILGWRVSVGQGIVGWAVENKETLSVFPTYLDSRFFSGVDEQTGFVTRSVVCVPIIQAGQVLGAIEVINKLTGQFTHDDVVILQEIARTMADYMVQA